MGYGQEYGALLEEVAKEADAIAMRYFRAEELRIERKGDGTAVTQADEWLRAGWRWMFWVKKWAAAMQSLLAIRGERG